MREVEVVEEVEVEEDKTSVSNKRKSLNNQNHNRKSQ